MDNLNKLSKALNVFRAFDTDLSVTCAAVFCCIATHDGKLTVNTMAKTIDLAQSSASRNVSRLSKIDRHRKPGLGLIEARVDDMDRRIKYLHLTDQGKVLAKALFEITN